MSEEICKILLKYLDFDCKNKDIKLSDINNYDSLSHIQIMSDIENLLNLDFTFEDIESISYVRDIYDLVSSKVK